ncbi:MFS transporter [Oceanicella actignis]|uniref:MFS transporter n=1 Tax=Oceanicella actignis TaxID=1189325 RepID=UPI0011E65CC1|nr:MFS transporter [Oceanicella actignis]TYO88846.1 sugar phosphate permease [Oceanicella actignis]
MDVAALFAAYVLSQFFRSFLAVLSPGLTADLGLSAVQLSDAAGAWFMAFALAQFPIGVALDRIGPRRTVGWLMLVGAAGGSLLFASAQSAGALIAAMALIGVGCAPVLMAGMFIFARRHAPARFATLSGLMIGFGSLGNVLGAGPLAHAAEAFGWRGVMLGLAAMAALLAAIALTAIRDPERIAAEGDSALGGVLAVLRMRVLWPLLPLAVFNYASSAGIRGLWAGPYLSEVHGMDAIGIGQAMTWMALGMVAGSVLIGSADRLLGTRKWLNLSANAIGAACVAVLAMGVAPQTATALMTAIGFFGASYAALMAHARSFFPAHLTGRGVTVMNFFSIGGVGLGQFATGRIAEAAADPADPAAAFHAIFAYYAATLTVALAIYLFSRDSKP